MASLQKEQQMVFYRSLLTVTVTSKYFLFEEHEKLTESVSFRES